MDTSLFSQKTAANVGSLLLQHHGQLEVQHHGERLVLHAAASRWSCLERKYTYTRTHTHKLHPSIHLFCPLLQCFISILWTEAWDKRFLLRPTSLSSRPEVSIYSSTLLDWLVHLRLQMCGEDLGVSLFLPSVCGGSSSPRALTRSEGWFPRLRPSPPLHLFLTVPAFDLNRLTAALIGITFYFFRFAVEPSPMSGLLSARRSPPSIMCSAGLRPVITPKGWGGSGNMLNPEQLLRFFPCI